MRNLKTKSRPVLRRIMISLVTACMLGTQALAGPYVLSPGAAPCEADWINRSRFDIISSNEAVRKYMEARAEQGSLEFQLRLGLARKSEDGKWTTPADQSYSMAWLKKAADQGSKFAEWKLRFLQYRVKKEVPYIDYWRSKIAAAQEEGNPWAATELWEHASGRYVSPGRPLCNPEISGKDECDAEALTPASTAAQWATIAAEGGNAAAQEWLCFAAANGKPEQGQPLDETAALRWCQIATHNACALRSQGELLTLYKKGVGGAQATSPEELNRLHRQTKQPWRNATFFSAPPPY